MESRFIEEPPSVAKDIRDVVVESVKLPRFSREEIFNELEAMMQRKMQPRWLAESAALAEL